MPAKLFEYVVLYHPKPTKKDGVDVTERSQILVDLKRDLANSDKEIAIRAAREIPDAYLDRLEQVEIAIRPF